MAYNDGGANKKVGNGGNFKFPLKKKKISHGILSWFGHVQKSPLNRIKPRKK